MNAPNTEMALPQTALFTGKEGSAQWLNVPGGLDYVYLPKGASMVHIVATGLAGVRIRPNLLRSGGARTTLTEVVPESDTQRVYTGTFANANEFSNGFWLKIWVDGLTAGQAATGTVGVTITPMQVG